MACNKCFQNNFIVKKYNINATDRPCRRVKHYLCMYLYLVGYFRLFIVTTGYPPERPVGYFRLFIVATGCPSEWHPPEDG